LWLKTVPKVKGIDVERVIRLSESRFPELM
jgi:hypothetical protein